MSGTITVVGLGPAGPELLTEATSRAIAAVDHRILRTSRHPAAVAVDPADTCDDLYEAAETMDGAYEAIVERVLAAAADGDVLYAVPGSPRVAERTVVLLEQRCDQLGDEAPRLRVLPAMSFLDLVWDRLRVDPLARRVSLVDGHDFAAEAAGLSGGVLVAQCDRPDVLSDIKLAVDDGAEPDEPVTLLHHLGLPDEVVATVAWADLDRTLQPDHLTSLFIPSLGSGVGGALVGFVEIVRRLRTECPWDREQTHASLRRHLVDEAAEVLDALDHLGEPDGMGVAAGADHLCEELGDLLLQIVLHATIAAETGAFTMTDVADGVAAKMVRRHPHVFGDVVVDDAGEVATNWEAIKAAERRAVDPDGPARSVLDGVPATLPTLARAQKLSRKAARVGFDWPDVSGVWAKVREELAELAAEPDDADELGDVLFSLVNLARHLGHDADTAAREAALRFEARFREVERLADERGIDLDAAGIDELEALWGEVKAALR